MSQAGSGFGSGVISLIEERARAVRSSVGAVPSPCLSVCRMDAGSDLCLGCFRDIDEICRWSAMHDEDKRAVWQLIEQRSRAAAMRAKP